MDALEEVLERAQQAKDQHARELKAQLELQQKAQRVRAQKAELREREAELAQLQTAYQLAYAQLAKDKTRLQRCERQLGGTAWLVL